MSVVDEAVLPVQNQARQGLFRTDSVEGAQYFPP